MRGNKTPRLKFSQKIAIAITLEISTKNRDRDFSKSVKPFLLITLKSRRNENHSHYVHHSYLHLRMILK